MEYRNETKELSTMPEESAKIEHEKVQKITQSPVFRQMLISVTVWISYFVTGLIAGSPTPATVDERLSKINMSTVEAVTTADDVIISFIAFIIQESGLVWAVILPLFMDYFGRKTAFVVVNFNVYLLLIIFFFTLEPVHTIISNIVLGLSLSCGQNISATILAECIDPKHRGTVLAIKSVIFFFGFWISNALGTSFFWKNSWFIAMACSAYFVLILLCPESPYWLASKGKFDECAISHRWLRGTDLNAEKELESLLDTQKNCIKCTTCKSTYLQRLVDCLREYTSPEFYKPMLVIMLLFLQYYTTGKTIITFNVLQALSRITENEIMTYTLLLYFDLFTLFAMCFGSILIRFFNRRVIYTATTVSSITIMLVTSVYLSLVSLQVLSFNCLYFLLLLVVINTFIGCGPLVLCSTIFAELLTLRFKTSMLIILGVYLNFLYWFTKKMTTLILTSMSTKEVFFLFAGLSATCFMLLYKLIPETKDKTLLEIEENFKRSIPKTDKATKLNAA